NAPNSENAENGPQSQINLMNSEIEIVPQMNSENAINTMQVDIMVSRTTADIPPPPPLKRWSPSLVQ
ncbi:hypothetical protein A2U01_0118996, partial [Trifolium medium]|nr:hypothetical protein [Trifolium medium]